MTTKKFLLAAAAILAIAPVSLAHTWYGRAPAPPLEPVPLPIAAPVAPAPVAPAPVYAPPAPAPAPAQTQAPAYVAPMVHAGPPPMMGPPMGPGDIPPNARPGQCYARVMIPAQYDIVRETVVVREGFDRLSVSQPRFAPSNTTVISKEEGKRYVVRQPTWKTVSERVMVKPESERLEVVPAQYRTETETVVVREPRMVWKPGRNLSSIQRVDPNTGAIYCLVEEPGETRTITRQVLVAPETVRRISVPAEYITVTKQVMADPGEVQEVKTPAELRSVPTHELVAPGAETKTPVPAQLQTVERKVLIAPERWEWVSVLCETNATASIVRNMQEALRTRGYYHGPIDGIIGPQTMRGLEAFQRAQGIAHSGYITQETLDALGVITGARMDRGQLLGGPVLEETTTRLSESVAQDAAMTRISAVSSPSLRTTTPTGRRLAWPGKP